MPNFGAVLKAEIARLAKKAARTHTNPTKATTAVHRHEIAQLKRRVAALEQLIGRLQRASNKASPASQPPTSGTTLRFQAKGLRSLRARLGLSAGEFGKLMGVSAQSVYNWEAEKTVPRRAQVAALAQLRALGKREALKRLQAAP